MRFSRRQLVPTPLTADSSRLGRASYFRASDIAAIVAATAAYFVTGKLGLRMAFLHASATPVWPPTGIALAALLLIGYRVWPGIFLGAFLVNITTLGSVASTVGIATGNTLEAVIGAYLASKFASGSRAFERSQDIVKFWFLAGMLSTMVAATLGVTSLCLTGFASWQDYGSIWLTWWLGDATGGFLVASVLILWSTQRRPQWRRPEVLEAVTLLLSLSVLGSIVFFGWFPHPYLCLPLLLWAAFRFGPRETATTTLLLSGIAIWGTLHGSGPFVEETRNESLLVLQAFMAVTAVTALAVAALVSDRKGTARALWEAHDRLEQRVEERTETLSRLNEALHIEIDERARAEERFRKLLESAPDAMVIVNEAGQITLVNSQVERIFGYTRDELIGQPVEILMPRGLRGIHTAHRGGYYADPRVRAMGLNLDLRGARKDGTEFPVAISLSPIETAEGPVVCAAVRDTSDQKRLEQQLADAARRRAEDLRDFAVSVQRAQEDERRRIARELHDELGQRLTGLKLALQVMEDDILEAGHELPGRLQKLGQDIDQMIVEVRRLSYNLRPAALDDFGPIAALQMLCKEFEKVHKVRTRFRADEPEETRHDAHVDIALYRIAQEALSNVAKHAEATTVSVRLSRHDHTVAVIVEDNGRGFDVKASRTRRKRGAGLGLVSMMERSHLLGGKFRIQSTPREGTKVEAELPLAAPNVDEANQNTNRR
jgi:PAS domain S-box-containing protein